jgi:hypothetical protein
MTHLYFVLSFFFEMIKNFWKYIYIINQIRYLMQIHYEVFTKVVHVHQD